jgi:tetratricopeptide (TPR) repeat protein
MRARRAVGDDGQSQTAIRTITGFGYRWVMNDATHGAPMGPLAAMSPIAPDVERESDRSNPPVVVPKRDIFRTLMICGVIFSIGMAAAGFAFRQARQSTMRDGPPTTPSVHDILAVLPLRVDGPAEVQWIRFGAMDLIANRLRGAGMAVAPSENVVALAGANEAADESVTDAWQRTLGADRLVQGTVSRNGQLWKVELSTTSTEGLLHRADAERPDVTEAARQAADLLLASLGHTPPNDAANEQADLISRLQQAQSALLANQLDTARAILAGAPAPDRDDPRLRYRLAQIDVKSGRLQPAENALGELLETPALRAQPALHSRALTTRGLVYFRRRQFAEAERDFDAAAMAISGDETAAEFAQALTGRGIARVGLRHFDEAANDLGRARLQFEKTGDTLGKARVDANFGLLESERGRPEQALPYLLDAAARFEAYGVVDQTVSILIGAFDAQVALLRWIDALATADRQWALRDHVGDPGLGIVIAVNRAGALAALGRQREAHAMLDDAERRYPDARDEDRRFLFSLRAELAWKEGRSGDALSAAERALAIRVPDDFDESRAMTVLTRQRALIALGRATAANIESVWPSAGNAPSAQAGLAVARAEWAVQRGDSGNAEREFRSGLSNAETSGLPATIALVSQAFANWLLATGRNDEAGAIAGRIAPWAERDFDCALLQVRVLHAQEQSPGWNAALLVATRLAGEREIPADLRSMGQR